MVTIPVRWQRWLDIYIFCNAAGYFAWQTWQVLCENRLDFIEGTFIIHNIIICLCFLLRLPAKAIQTKFSHQAVAIVAFYSGVFFMGPPQTSSSLLLEVSWWTLLVGMLIGIGSLVNLGKSFGVLIAVREVRTTGIYSVIRHPMYLSDIVMRLGYLLSHPTMWVAMLFFVSSACYIVRALLEEQFLCRVDATYLTYKEKTRYRFIPGVL